ncbi:MAG: AAA family ATPase [Methanomicrobiales archaeon]|nr:AAA family ATPase [Methanomicrobiales archaeon]
MRIQKIQVSNFKTFNSAEITLDPFNVIIGSNAAGKSNFIAMLQFLKDMAGIGLRDAISLQGGPPLLRNIALQTPVTLSLVCEVDLGGNRVTMSFCESRDTTIEATVQLCVYRLDLVLSDDTFHIERESLSGQCDFLSCETGEHTCTLGRGVMNLERGGDGIPRPSVTPEEIARRIDFGTRVIHPLNPDESILERPVFFPPLSPLIFQVADLFRSIAIFDLDPGLAKRAAVITGKSTLSSDGSNLSLALRRIVEDPARKRKMILLLTDLLPFVEEIQVEAIGDHTLITSLVETYTHTRAVPAPLLSDGTIQIIALVIALYFEDRSPLVIEEPGRNIHPALISKIIDMMKDVTTQQERQIIITTHNPEIVKYAGADQVILLQRDEQGNSILSRPRDHEEIRTFLETMGIEELYVQNLLS